MGVPQIIHFNGIFHYKPSSYWGTPIYRNPHPHTSGTKPNHCSSSIQHGLARKAQLRDRDITHERLQMDFLNCNVLNCKWWLPEIGVPPAIIHFNGIFYYKPTIFWGTPLYGNPQMLAGSWSRLEAFELCYACTLSVSTLPNSFQTCRTRFLENHAAAVHHVIHHRSTVEDPLWAKAYRVVSWTILHSYQGTYLS